MFTTLLPSSILIIYCLHVVYIFVSLKMLIFVIKFVCYITFQVEQLQTNTFNVKYNNKKKFSVDLEKRTCTCRQFDLDEIPYSHAIAGIDKLYRNKYEYFSKWYDIMMYNVTARVIKHIINPFLTRDLTRNFREIFFYFKHL